MEKFPENKTIEQRLSIPFQKVSCVIDLMTNQINSNRLELLNHKIATDFVYIEYSFEQLMRYFKEPNEYFINCPLNLQKIYKRLELVMARYVLAIKFIIDGKETKNVPINCNSVLFKPYYIILFE